MRAALCLLILSGCQCGPREPSPPQVHDDPVADPDDPDEAPPVAEDPAPEPLRARVFRVPEEYEAPEQLPFDRGRFDADGRTIRIDDVRHPDASVRAELLTALRALAVAIPERSHYREQDGSSGIRVACHPVLAHASVLSYKCVLEQPNDRGGGDQYCEMVTFAVRDGHAIRVENDQLWLDSSLAQERVVHAFAEGDPPEEVYAVSMGVAPDGIFACALVAGGNSALVGDATASWEDLHGIGLLSDGPLGALFPHAREQERVIEIDPADSSCAFVVSGVATYAELHERALEAGVRALMSVDAEHGRLVRLAPRVSTCAAQSDAAQTLATRLGSVPHPIPPAQANLRFAAARSLNAINLRAAPGEESAIVSSIPPGAHFDVLLGPIPGHRSELGLSGTWTYSFVPSRGAGWLAGRWTEPLTACTPSRDVLTGSAAARVDGVQVALTYEVRDNDLVVHRSDAQCHPQAEVFRTRLPGALVDLRFPTRSRDGDALVMVASRNGENVRYTLHDPALAEPLWTHEVASSQSVHVEIDRASGRDWSPVVLGIGRESVRTIAHDGVVEER